VGFGHVRRCLTLAGALQDVGLAVVFELNADAETQQLVQDEGFEAHLAEQRLDPAATLRLMQACSATAAVVDDYGPDDAYFRALHASARLVVLDDLADRRLDADLIVNGTAGAAALVYESSPGTSYLLGPEYMLLRPEFGRQPGRRHPVTVHRVLVTTGGGDPHGLGSSLASCAAESLPDAVVDHIVGPLALAGAALPDQHGRIHVHRTPGNVRELMAQADVAISAGGQTLYELAACGTPIIAVEMADNQRLNIAGLAAAGCLVAAGNACHLDIGARVSDLLRQLDRDVPLRSNMSASGRQTVDGLGAPRVAKAVADLVGASR
jgi:UDP-2,4-diacetamido-2,4,6-trideoxy-beta-L-altropyranose hydrolase